MSSSNPNACTDHQDQPSGQRGCTKCVDVLLPAPTEGVEPVSEVSVILDTLTTQITDLYTKYETRCLVHEAASDCISDYQAEATGLRVKEPGAHHLSESALFFCGYE